MNGKLSGRSRIGLLTCFLLAAACEPLGPVGPTPVPHANPSTVSEIDLDILTSRIRIALEARDLIGPGVEMEILEFGDSELPPLRRGVLRLWTEAQEQEIVFHASADGRWFLREDPIDLLVDPIAEAVATIDIGPDVPSLGREDAVVTIVEYADFQCPFCARAGEILLDEVHEAYGEQVRIVSKPMPLEPIHPWARVAAEIGLCVLREGGNDAYWKYHREVFARQEKIEEANAAAELLALTDSLGVDVEAVRRCEAEDATIATIDASLVEAARLGVKSTPTFFVNGRRLSGAQPASAFRSLIDAQIEAPG